LIRDNLGMTHHYFGNANVKGFPKDFARILTDLAFPIFKGFVFQKMSNQHKVVIFH